MITDREREAAVDRLTRSQQVLLEAVDGLSDTQAQWDPPPLPECKSGRWSILEYVEHLAVADGELVALVERSLRKPAQPETDEQRKAREQRIRETPMPRGVNHAPPALQPEARFESLEQAVAAFLAARERTLEYARTTQAQLREHFTDHPVLGAMDGYQWLVANARHVESHASHIKEIRALPGFPAS